MEIESISTLGTVGWLEFHLSGPNPPRLIAKVAERDGRGYIARLILVGDHLDSATLKQIPISRIESAINHPELGLPPGIARGLSQEVLDEMAAKGVLHPEQTGALDEAITALLDRPQADKPVIGRRTWKRRLTRPDGTDPDRFYQQVAAAYNQAVLRTSAPAVQLAEEAAVPVATVRRWIAEARRRGFLAPARKGRAG